MDQPETTQGTHTMILALTVLAINTALATAYILWMAN